MPRNFDMSKLSISGIEKSVIQKGGEFLLEPKLQFLVLFVFGSNTY